MKMQGLCLLCLFFRCFFVSSAIIEKKMEDNFFILSKILVYILKSCKKDYYAAVIDNRTDESVSRHLGNLQSVAVNFQDNLLESKFRRSFKKSKERVDLFIATVENSVDELNKILYDLKFSRWWDIMMPHFIMSGSDHGCQDVTKALKMIWQMKILNCYYICFDSERIPFIYTFNPYSNRTPHQWKMVEEISNSSYYMAIYNRLYDEDDICQGFDFDRTKYVEKVQVTVSIPSEMESFQYGSHIVTAMENVFNTSIVQMSVSCDSDDYLLNNIFSGINKTDVTWCSIIFKGPLRFAGRIRSYPVIHEGLYILSSNNRYLSPMEKIDSAFDFSLILGTIIISIITYLVILFTNSNRRYSFTTFEIIRLWIGVSLNTGMHSQSLRIFFSSVFIYFLAVQTTLQGDLVNCLSKTKLGKNVNFLSDLRNNNYQQIFRSYDVLLNVFNHESIVKAKIQRYQREHLYPSECVEKVIQDPSSVCITYYDDILTELMRSKLSKNTLQSLHLSRNPINTRLRSYLTLPDWPLKKKFDKFLSSINTFGINLKSGADDLARIISNLQTSEYVASFQPISLDSLSSVFSFWLLGISLSFICFFVETFNVSKKYIANCISVAKKKICKSVDKKLKLFRKIKKQKVMVIHNKKEIIA